MEKGKVLYEAPGSPKSLTRYGVEYRYPGVRATTRRMRAALRQAERVRCELRERLGLS